jgi:TctA family transporter
MTTNEPSSTSTAKSDIPFYLLAALAGIGTGWADVAVNDLLFTALLVLASCMLLGILRPHWPWRWVVAVGVFIPLTEFAAYFVQAVKPSRGQVYGSFLAFLPGIAGAYGGSLLRGVVDNLREGK